MQLFKDTLNIDFMGKRKLAVGVSILILALSLGSLYTRGLNLGLDFSGGTLIEVGYEQPVEVSAVRKVLVDTGYGDAVVQHFGSSRDVRIRINQRENESSAELSDHILLGLKQQDSSVQMRRVEFVGPQIGDELREDGGLAMLYALIGIMVYVALRFEYRFAIGSVTALFHDVLIILGIFSVFQLEFDLTVLAALLAVIGYSLNDTIVVYDRIRENFIKVRKSDTMSLINISLNQTLSRTLMTSFTTLLVLISLFYFGGEMIHGFATALLIGVVVGTYSSIYVASVMAVVLGVSREDLLPVEKEGAELDDMP